MATNPALRPQNLHRGTNKLKVDFGVPAMYRVFCQTNPKIWNVDGKLYKQIIRDFNVAVRDKMMYEGYVFRIPLMGSRLRIIKKPMNFKKLPPVDYKRSYELGYIVRHLNENRANCTYKIFWDKFSIRAYNYRYYKFKACRTFSRMLSAVLQTNPTIDFFEKN